MIYSAPMMNAMFWLWYSAAVMVAVAAMALLLAALFIAAALLAAIVCISRAVTRFVGLLLVEGTIPFMVLVLMPAAAFMASMAAMGRLAFMT